MCLQSSCLKMVVSVPTMLLSLLLLLLMATATVSSDSADSTVFTITPNKTSSDCQPPETECTLEQFQEQYMSGELNISANTTLDFLPGTHLLDSHLKVNNTDKFVMQAKSSGSNINITCMKSASFDFANITLLQIDQITFFGCGSLAIGWDNNSTSAAIKIANVSEVWLSNITILHSRGSAIAAIHSSLTISDTSISNSSGSGLIVDSCAKVTFLAGLVQFSNNSTPYSGGAIQASNSNISTSDKVLMEFNDNSADNSGGAICLNVSSVTIFGACAFTGNTAVSGHGGAIFANGAGIESVIVKGTATFENNKAECDLCNGGAIHTNHAKLEIVGTEGIRFIQNRSGFKGGAICVWFSNYTSLNGNIKFLSNFAHLGGGAIDVEVTETFQLSGTVIFEDNHAIFFGGAIELLHIISNVIISGDIDFTRNNAQHEGGAIYVLIADIVQFAGNIVFVNNSAGRESEGQGIGGALMVVDANTVSFVLKGSTIFEGNGADIGDAIATINVHNIEVIGSSSKEILFLDNNASSYGGAMYMDSSTLHLHRNVKFVKNSAYEGGGLYLDEKSKCFLGYKVQVLFQENHAHTKGGGVFISSSDRVTTCVSAKGQIYNIHESYLGTECTIQWIQGRDVSLHFVNNTAGAAGYALYGGSIDTCHNKSYYYLTTDFNEIVKIEQNLETNISNISSDPYKVCKCSPNGAKCEGTELHLSKYPGQNFTLNVLAFGQRDGTVPATIVAPQASWINFSISNYHPQDTTASCSMLKYAILPLSKEIHSVKFELKPEGNCIALSKGLKVNIEIKECPTAFHFSSTMGCECAHELEGYTDKCSIDNQTIFCSKDKKFWVGVDENSSLVLYPHCPFDYCKPGDIWIPVNNTDEQCSNNRTGLLCSKCKTNYSLMLGSSACSENCSNLYLFLIVAFAVAGLALVVFFFALKLTVAEGTINGLVFYANIVHTHRTLFPSKDSFLAVFIAWINLDLGIPMCFYRGMDMSAKTWLQFVFPVYIWILCGSIIILSGKSSKLSKLLGKNPVAVLSTLFLLSYTKLVKVVITAMFSFATLEYPNGLDKVVWLFDANVSNAKHAPLIIASMLMFFLLFPYTVLLFASQWFQRWSNYRLFSWMNSPRVKYFLDTYHAPFKPKHRYWTGLLLIVRVVLQLVINNVYSPVNSTLVLCVIILLLIMWQTVVGNSYSHSFQSILEVTFLVNLEILAAASLYCYAVESYDRTTVAQTSAGVAFATFVIVLFHHFYLQLKDSKLWHRANCTETHKTVLRSDANDETETSPILDVSSYSYWHDARNK